MSTKRSSTGADANNTKNSPIQPKNTKKSSKSEAMQPSIPVKKSSKKTGLSLNYSTLSEKSQDLEQNGGSRALLGSRKLLPDKEGQANSEKSRKSATRSSPNSERSPATTQKPRKPRNHTIDVARLIFAFLVVWIHCGRNMAIMHYGTSEVLGLIVTAFAILAVPMFFAISGYFLYSPDQPTLQARCKKSLKKLLVIFILWEVFVFIFSLALGGSLGGLIRSVFSATSLSDLFFLNIPLFSANYLWFLVALIYSIALIYINSRFSGNNHTLLLTLGILGFVIGLIFTTYTDLFATNYAVQAKVNTNWFGQGLLFTMIGFLIHKHEDTIASIPRKNFIIFTIITFLLYALEFYTRYHTVGAFPLVFISQFMLPAVVVALFVIFLKHPNLGRGTPVPAWGAKYALYIYLLHVPISTLFIRFLFKDTLTQDFPTAIFYTTLIYISSFIVSVLLVKCINLITKTWQLHRNPRRT